MPLAFAVAGTMVAASARTSPTVRTPDSVASSAGCWRDSTRTVKPTCPASARGTTGGRSRMTDVPSVAGMRRRTGVSTSAQGAAGPSTVIRSSSTTVPVLRTRIDTMAIPPGSAATDAGLSEVETLSDGRETGRGTGAASPGRRAWIGSGAAVGVPGDVPRGMGAPQNPQKRASGSGTSRPHAAHTRMDSLRQAGRRRAPSRSTPG